MKSPPLAIPQLASTSLRCVEIDVPNLTLAELESASDRGAFAVRSNDALIRNRQALTFMSRLRDLHGSPQNCRLRSFVASPNALHWLGALQHDSPGEDKEVDWLPAPSERAIRPLCDAYSSKSAALDGTWKAPPRLGRSADLLERTVGGSVGAPAFVDRRAISTGSLPDGITPRR